MEKDVFAHASEFRNTQFGDALKQQTVTFDLVEDDLGRPTAKNVRLASL